MAKEVGVGRGRAAGSRACWFKPGHPGRKGAKPGETGPPKGCVMPGRLLRDARRVMAQPGADDTPSQAVLRRMLAADAGKFLDLLIKLERVHERRRAAAEGNRGRG